MSQFTINQPVKCIDDSRFNPTLFIDIEFWVEKNKIYHVREITDNKGIAPAIRLHELRNIPKKFNLLDNDVVEPAFAEWRFRALTQEELEKYQSQQQNNFGGGMPFNIIIVPPQNNK